MRRPQYRDFDDHDVERDEWSDDRSADETDEESLDEILASARELTDDSTEISMEVDDDGNEVWYAEDPKIPGSSSLGNSLEEAMEGMEDRRREYREMISGSRTGEGPRKPEDVSRSELDQARKQYRQKLKRSRERERDRDA